MLKTKCRSWGQHDAILLSQLVRQWKRWDSEIIVQQSKQPTTRRSPGEDILVISKPALRRCQVLLNNCIVPFDDAVAMFEREHCESIVEFARAERNVIAHGPACRNRFCGRCNPANTESRQTERLGEGSHADSGWPKIKSRRSRMTTSRNFQPAISFIAEHSCTDRRGQSIDSLHFLLA